MFVRKLVALKLKQRLLSYFFPRPERPLASSRGFAEINPYGAVLAPEIW